ncbi:MAG: hypothetical protein NTV98_00830 [Candidatus Roizmanbacteria bacterium]|nr:hypothetical protein [Candidatus Roizmanbacteria bacterium]
MEQFNKALSFILGLVVVAVFIIVASGKFNFKGLNVAKTTTTVSGTPTPKPTSKPWFFFGSKPTVAPTVKPNPTSVPQTISYSNSTGQQQNQQDPNFHTYTSVNTPTSIPNTGVPIVLFPLFGTSLLTGIFMKKSGKRD